MSRGDWTRREFLRAAAAAGVTGALGPAAIAEDEAPPPLPPMPMRSLGRTGLRVSLFGLGGYYLGRMQSDAEAEAVIRRAIEVGVNYVDTAPSYNRGVSERRIGTAIKGRRDRVVLATKSFQTEPTRVLAELEESLRRLGTDRVDLFQMHSLRDRDDLEQRFGPGGAIEAFVKAKKQGKARFLGVTGHVDPEIMAGALGRFAFDTILLPANCVDPHYLSFVEKTLPRAVEKGMGVIAMKVFAAGKLLEGEKPAATPEECIRYAASLPVATQILGCDSVAQVDRDAAAVRAAKPMADADRKALLDRTKPHAGRKTERYKRRA